MSNQGSFSTRLTRNWKRPGSMEVGHRGGGSSFRVKNKDGKIDTSLLSDQRENSISSFNIAHSVGRADMVEFDVTMTRDFVPIIYHDLVVLYNDVPTALAEIELSDIHTGTKLQIISFKTEDIYLYKFQVALMICLAKHFFINLTLSKPILSMMLVVQCCSMRS